MYFREHNRFRVFEVFCDKKLRKVRSINTVDVPSGLLWVRLSPTLISFLMRLNDDYRVCLKVVHTKWLCLRVFPLDSH